jgi:hypothetical protein
MKELTLEDRVSLTHAIMALLEDWGVKPADQVALLGLPDGTPTRKLRRFHDETPLPDEPRVREHVGHLMEIADALRTTYPRNDRMGVRWMHRPSRHFAGRAPLAVMAEDGLRGLIAVRSHLDCTFAWDLTGSSHRSSAAR